MAGRIQNWLGDFIQKVCQPKGSPLDEWSDLAPREMYVNDLDKTRQSMLTKFLHDKKVGRTNVIVQRNPPRFTRFTRLRHGAASGKI